MFSRQTVNQNAKMNFLGNYFWNLETPVFIFYVFITEIYLTNIWRDNWRFSIWRCKRTPHLFVFEVKTTLLVCIFLFHNSYYFCLNYAYYISRQLTVLNKWVKEGGLSCSKLRDKVNLTLQSAFKERKLQSFNES